MSSLLPEEMSLYHFSTFLNLIISEIYFCQKSGFLENPRFDPKYNYVPLTLKLLKIDIYLTYILINFQISQNIPFKTTFIF